MPDRTENDAKEKFVGRVSAVRGSVVDAVFDQELPPINSILRAGPEGSFVIEVVDHLDPGSVRGIALTASAGLGRGDEIRGDGRPLQAPVGSQLLGRMFNVFGQTIDNKAQPENYSFKTIHQAPIALSQRVTKEHIFVTGIKAIDLLVPLEQGGKAGLFGGAGVGKTVLITKHILRHRGALPGRRGALPGDGRSRRA